MKFKIGFTYKCPKCGIQFYAQFESADGKAIRAWCSQCEHTYTIIDEGLQSLGLDEKGESI